MELLEIEYHFIRASTNYIGIYSLAERLKASQRCALNDPASHELLLDDEEKVFVKEVVSSTSAILSKVKELADLGSLKYCPVRTFVHIIKASISLITVMELGLSSAEETTILDLLDEASVGLRICVVDDSHLSSRVGNLLEVYVRRLREKPSSTRKRKEPCPDVEESPYEDTFPSMANGIDPTITRGGLISESQFAEPQFNISFLQGLSDDSLGLQMPSSLVSPFLGSQEGDFDLDWIGGI